MKRKIMIGVLILVILLLFIGCTCFFCDYFGTITIYTMEWETFQAFLQENDLQYLTQNCVYHNEYIAWDYFDPYGAGDYFDISRKSFNLMKFTGFLEHYLAKQGVKEKIVDTAIIDVAYIPLSTWIKTEKNTYFLTIEDAVEYSDDDTYHLYTQAEYLEKFYNEGNPQLTIKGEPVPAFSHVEIHKNHADIPLETVLLSLGATFQEIGNDNTKIRVKFLGNDYTLIKSGECSLDSEGLNLLVWYTGEERFCVCFNEKTGEVHVDDDTLEHTLNRMGMPVDVTYDSVTHVLDISPRTS